MHPRPSRTSSRSTCHAVLLRSIMLAVVLLFAAGSTARADEAAPLGPRQVANSSESTAKPESTGQSVWRTFGSLTVVVVLIIGCGFVVRRVAANRTGLMAQLGAGGKAPSGVLEVLGRYPVSRGSTLVVLRFDRRVLLIAQNSGRAGVTMQPICELSEAEDVASILLKCRDAEGESLAAKFQEVLAQADEAEDRSVVNVPVRTEQPLAARSSPVRRAQQPVSHDQMDGLRAVAAIREHMRAEQAQHAAAHHGQAHARTPVATPIRRAAR